VKERENPAGSRPTTWVPFSVIPPRGHAPNNSLGTRKQLLHYASISHACVSAGRLSVVLQLYNS